MADRLIQILKQDYSELIPGSGIVSCGTLDDKMLTSHPLENGGEFSDHTVRQLVEITVDVELTENAQAEYEALFQAYMNDEVLIVQTRMRIYDRMLLTSVPHLATPRSGATVNLRLKEIKEVQAQYGELPPRSVADPADTSTVKRGTQQSRDTTGQEKADVESKARKSSALKLFEWGTK